MVAGSVPYAATMMVEGTDQWLDPPARRRRTSALLVSLRELSVLMSVAIEESVGDTASSNGAVLVLAHLAEEGPLRSGTLGRKKERRESE